MLRFDIGDIPVRVHFSFLVIAFFGPSREIEEIVIWTFVAFLAVLLHEVGHALAARAYGMREISITLFALGGATVFPVSAKLTPAKRFVVSAAGSAVGIVLGGSTGLLWLNGAFAGANSQIRLAVLSFIWAGLGWGILNWIPIRPLDGGQMLTSALEIMFPERGEVIARVVSGIVGAAVVLVAIVMRAPFLVVFVALITIIGLQTDSTAPSESSRIVPRRGPKGNAPSLQIGDAGEIEQDYPEPPVFPI